tara:strand:- start:579 stop:704 length:126 start_codon:yes stop_codon:yes gene_type:complete
MWIRTILVNTSGDVQDATAAALTQLMLVFQSINQQAFIGWR